MGTTDSQAAGSNNPGGNSSKKVNSQRVDYWSKLLKTVTADSDTATGWVGEVRSKATAIAQELALPSTRDEDWRFTDLSPLLDIEFSVAGAIATPSITTADVAIKEAPGSRIVFVNGRHSSELSDLSALGELADKVTVSAWSAGHDSVLNATVESNLGKIQTSAEAFTALNTSAVNEVAVISVGRNADIELPIHVVFLSSGAGAIAQPRCLVTVGSNSRCTVVEEHRALGNASDADAPYWVNGVTEISLADNAEINHARVQRDTPTAFHIGNTAVSQARDSRYTLTSLDAGARVSRHNVAVSQKGPGTHTAFNGLNVATERQTSDTHTFLNLQHPHGTADHLHKCVANDRGHTVFNGRVFVGQQAQQTDAAQLNRNLLLSSKARVDTKPQLEIIADDVKCTHGATVSQLEDNEIFYLRSRGLDETAARRLLLDGFVGEILERLPVQSLRDPLAVAIAAQIRANS
ncbi:MAG: Fe-S cluster assembly protein SufD [Cyanobacteria bacterium P01_D01_bin.73]